MLVLGGKIFKIGLTGLKGCERVYLFLFETETHHPSMTSFAEFDTEILSSGVREQHAKEAVETKIDAAYEGDDEVEERSPTGEYVKVRCQC